MLKKCGWLLVSIILVCTCIFAVPSYVHADSGWDSDYGGSDWGGSDYGGSDYGGSDWGSDSDWDSSSSYSGTGSAAEFIVVVWFIIVIIIVSIAASSSRNNNAIVKETEINTIGDEDDLVKKFFPNLTEEQLLAILEEKFIDIQYAWMNFDYDALEKLCTKELYETYKSDLEILNSKGQKNVMSDFKRRVIDVTDIKEENGLITVSIYLHMSFYDYVIDTKNGAVVRGKKTMLHHNQYNLDFVVSKGFGKVCPNCGAEIHKEEKCPYCATPISNTYSDFVMSKKSRIG